MARDRRHARRNLLVERWGVSFVTVLSDLPEGSSAVAIVDLARGLAEEHRHAFVGVVHILAIGCQHPFWGIVLESRDVFSAAVRELLQSVPHAPELDVPLPFDAELTKVLAATDWETAPETVTIVDLLTVLCQATDRADSTLLRLDADTDSLATVLPTIKSSVGQIVGQSIGSPVIKFPAPQGWMISARRENPGSDSDHKRSGSPRRPSD